MLFSIIVCTYNRADQLAVLLPTLVSQQLDANKFEVLIIDNNSTDYTLEIAEQFCNNHSNWRYVREEKQGLSHARNRGWQEATADYVVYIDDDCKAPSEWLSNAEKVAREKNPDMFGGPYYPFYQSEKPKWLKDQYFTKIICDHPKELTKDDYLSGGNLFINKNLLEKIGGFNTDLGMSGKQMGVGEETALQNWVRKYMPEKIIYTDPEIYVYHLVPEYKMNLPYRAKRFISYGIHTQKINLVGNQKTNPIRWFYSLFKYAFLFLWSLTYQTLTRDQQQYPYFQNFWYEESMEKLIGIAGLFAKRN